MGRTRRSFALFRSSLRVLRQHRELAVFPVLSGLASLVVVASFAVPAFALSPHLFDDEGGGHPTAASEVLWFCGYLVLSFVTVFFNAALVHAADEALRGGDPNLARSLRAARGRLRSILPWALVAASVSLALRAVEQRFGFVGRIAVALVGLAWTLVTYLVLPLLVLEGVGVRAAVRRSSELFRRTWGQQVAGTVGVGLATFVLAVAGLPVIVVGMFLGTAGFVAAAALLVLWWLTLAVLASTMSTIYRTALYRFAADSWAAPAFASADLPHAFPPKRRWGRRQQ